MKLFKQGLVALGLVLSVSFLLTGCGTKVAKDTGSKDEKIKVVATNSIIADMAHEVGQDKIDLHSIVPVGTDPHEYEPLPEDIEKATNADVIFYNGLNLETGGHGWFIKLMETAKKEEGKDYVVISEGVEPKYLTSKGKEEETDPHAWLDIQNGITYVKNITHDLIKKDEKNKEFYQKNSDAYVQKLEKLDEEAKTAFLDIPEEKRHLITSEGAFKYFGAAYHIEDSFIWEINTDEEGTPEQMKTIVDKVKSIKAPVLFVESSVDPRSMESVSQETKLPIHSEIFTDSIAAKGKDGDSYFKMMEWNINQIREGLSQ